jgi:hypothetical protein
MVAYLLILSGAAFNELFKTEVVVPGFGGRSLKTIILMINQSPVITSNSRKAGVNFLKEVSVKKYATNGIITKKTIPVSFDIRARKKLIAPKTNANIDLDEIYFNNDHIEINPNRKQRISSRLFMLFTTSV